MFWMRGGRKLKPMAGNWWRQLVRIPYKTLCFCVVYENYNTVAAQAQHIQLQWKHTQNTMPETPRIIKPPGGGREGGRGFNNQGEGLLVPAPRYLVSLEHHFWKKHVIQIWDAVFRKTAPQIIIIL